MSTASEGLCPLDPLTIICWRRHAHRLVLYNVVYISKIYAIILLRNKYLE